mmetsp:Transcript_44411/g.129123  ORF Transcript_44411/g.129123 Transcript_44411/m.129123 type:complete len:235 (+) Transcript_44411:644-1348(+)
MNGCNFQGVPSTCQDLHDVSGEGLGTALFETTCEDCMAPSGTPLRCVPQRNGEWNAARVQHPIYQQLRHGGIAVPEGPEHHEMVSDPARLRMRGQVLARQHCVHDLHEMDYRQGQVRQVGVIQDVIRLRPDSVTFVMPNMRPATVLLHERPVHSTKLLRARRRTQSLDLFPSVAHAGGGGGVVALDRRRTPRLVRAIRLQTPLLLTPELFHGRHVGAGCFLQTSGHCVHPRIVR